jgi:predicted nucleic acid-binding protein
MILVDTSVWIEILAGRQTVDPDDMLRLVTCPPVLQEVRQGLRRTGQADAFFDNFLALPCLPESLPVSLFVAAAEIYREGRRRGITIRSSFDCLIAAIAIEHKVPVWHRDRDFAAISQYTPLRVVQSPAQVMAMA